MLLIGTIGSSLTLLVGTGLVLRVVQSRRRRNQEQQELRFLCSQLARLRSQALLSGGRS